MKQRIGFIGVGLMGHGIARNLLAKGHPLRFLVHRNRSNIQDLLDAGATEATTVAGLAGEADIVFLCVTGTPQVETNVYGAGGLLASCRRGTMVVDTSTAEPDSTLRIRDDFAAKGVEFVDAPLARTPREAEAGKLNTMVGATPETFARLKPVLETFCENVIHAGPPGAGHKIKLINNFLALGNACLIAEALAAAAKVGLDLDVLYRLVSAGGANSNMFQMMVPKALEGDFTGLLFALDNARKDLRYYTHMTESAPVASPIADTIHQTLLVASQLGFGDRFVPSLIEAHEKLNGLRIVERRPSRPR
jgi:3-hydroxyisobutyrate dehydrogenase-like beta-hydroxyacid dehydrogenase